MGTFRPQARCRAGGQAGGARTVDAYFCFPRRSRTKGSERPLESADLRPAPEWSTSLTSMFCVGSFGSTETDSAGSNAPSVCVRMNDGRIFGR